MVCCKWLVCSGIGGPRISKLPLVVEAMMLDALAVELGMKVSHFITPDRV